MDNKNVQRTMSDKRNSWRVAEAQVSLDDVLNIPVYRIQVGEHFYDGVIADDLETIVPQAVSESHGRKIIDYGMIVAPLLKAFQNYVKDSRELIDGLREDMKVVMSLLAEKQYPRFAKRNIVAKDTKWE